MAKDVIIATNVPWRIRTRGWYAYLEYPKQSYIVAAKLDGPLPPAMYITPGKPLHSILPVTTGKGNYLLLGGESHLPYLGGGPDHHYRRLEAFVKERFPVTSIDYRWYARDYISIDGMPLVGKLFPWSQHLHVATAFMKWGLTNGTIAGRTAADMVLGNSNEHTKTFDIDRLRHLRWIPKLTRYLTS